MYTLFRSLLVVILLNSSVVGALAQEAETTPENEVQTLHFKVTGMGPLTSTQVEGQLKQLPGVLEATADWKPGNVIVRFDPEVIEPEEIMDTVSGMGYYVEPEEND